MNNYVNQVVLSGKIQQIRSSANGTCFINLLQEVEYNGIFHQRQYELLISPEKFELISLVELGKCIKVVGELTIVKVKKYSIYKMMVNVTDMEILPDDSFGNGSSDVNTQDDSDQTF